MSEENKKSATPSIDEQGDLNIPTKHGVNISFNVTEILKLLITEHFMGTLFAIITGALIYISVVYNINFLTLIPVSDGYKLPIILDIILFLLLSITIKKIFALTKHVENNIFYSKDIIKQFDNLKNDIEKFSNSLYTFYDIYNESNISLVTLNKIVSDNIYDVKKIMNVLNNINNGIRRIPDKRTLLDILTIRTKLLFGSAIEIVSEYLASIGHNTNSIQNQLQLQQLQQLQQLYGNQNINLSNLLNNNNNKHNQFIEEKLQYKTEEIKNQYITDVFILSRNTLDIKCKDNIQNLLNDNFKEILEIIFKYNDVDNTVDIIIYNIDHIIKLLTVELMDIFTNNLHTITVFDSDMINNIIEEKE